MSNTSTILKQNVDKFAKDNNIQPPRCISDRILLYIRYGVDCLGKKELWEYMGLKRWEELKEGYEKQGREIRFNISKSWNGDQEYADGHIFYKLIESEKKELIEACMKIYELVRGDTRYTNKNPLSVAVGIVYIAAVSLCNLRVTQSDVKEVFRVSEASVATHYKLIVKDFKKDLEGFKLSAKNRPRGGSRGDYY